MSDNELNIAIIGISGEFPGAKNISEFWKNLVEGKESIQTLSEEDLRAAGISEAEYTHEHYVPRAGLLENVDLFDAKFFGYSPRDAALIDPQQRKLLEHAWLACEDAAINPLTLEESLGVFVGSSLNTYLLNNILSHPEVAASDEVQQILFGNGQDYLATRIAYQLNARGPAINIQTACSTSLVAVHEACHHLLTYQVDVALAGGVSINTSQKGYQYSVDGMMSADGHCRPFSDEANGTVFSSGLGIVVLKRLNDAREAGNPIYAIIRGSAVNNDGHQKVGYTAPSVDGQSEVIMLAQANASVLPSDIRYIETHGTATQLGDPIELSALQQVFSEESDNQSTITNFCAIGSLKSNIGHLDAAAGVAGLIKTALALYHEKIPPTLHQTRPTTVFDWKNSAFFVNNALTNIEVTEEPFIAGVSSFGIGGTNAHVILQQYRQPSQKSLSGRPALLVFSAKTASALHAGLRQFADAMPVLASASLHAIARTLQVGRAAFRYRTSFIVNSVEEAVLAIQQNNYVITSCEQVRDGRIPPVIESCNHQDLERIAEQWLGGEVLDWNAHYFNYRPTLVHLPGYAFERERYWILPYQPAVQKRPIDEWFYQPSWQRTPLSTDLANPLQGPVLVFVNEQLESIVDFEQLHCFGPVIKVYRGHFFEKRDQSTYQIGLTQAEDYRRLLEDLRQQNQCPAYVLHGLTLTGTKMLTTVDVFDAQQSMGLLSCLYLMQSWGKVFQNSPLKLTVLTNRLNCVAEAFHEPHKAPVLAAVKVIPKEYSQVQAQLIDLDCVDYPQHKKSQMKQIIQEIAKSHYDEEEITLRGMTRWLRRYVKTPIQAIHEEPFAENEQNVILITGGLGQLGLDIAEYFAEFPGIKLALVARTPFPQQADWPLLISQYDDEHPVKKTLQRLEKMVQAGCEVQIFSADVSHQSSIKAAIETIESS